MFQALTSLCVIMWQYLFHSLILSSEAVCHIVNKYREAIIKYIHTVWVCFIVSALEMTADEFKR